MHKDSIDHATEEDKLDRAMTSIDPMLQASLLRDERRNRRRKLFFWGALAMVTTIVCIAVIVTSADPTSTASPQAEQLAKEGWRLMQQGKLATAEQRFQTAVKTNPKDANIWNGLGWSQLNQQKVDEANQSFRRAVKLKSNHPAALNGLGQTQLMSGKLTAAEATFRRAVDDAPAARWGLARVLLLRKKFPEAEKLITQLLASDVEGLDREFLEEMKQAAVDQQVSPQLAKKLQPEIKRRRTGKVDSQLANAQNAKGWGLFQSGDASGAEEAFRRALAANPKHDGAKNGLGFALLNQGKAKEARPVFERLVKQNPKHPGFVNGLARSYMESGDTDKAIEIWKTVDSKDEVNAVTWGLARALTQDGELKQALAYWKRIDESTPNNPVVQEMLKKCGG